jgi:Zn-finger nucleic acid-binding protein
MICPRCKVEMKKTDYGEFGFVVLDVCPKCEGQWFDKGELDRLDDSVWTDAEHLDYQKSGEARAVIDCPNCSSKLVPVSPKDDSELTVDSCPSCEGFWLDKGELEKIRDDTLKKDAKIASSTRYTTRPPGWSALKWVIYCARECYFKQ